MIASGTAVWYHTGLRTVPIRWVLVRDPQGFDPQALLCTDLAAEPAQTLAWFVLRWQLEGHLRGGPATPRRRDPAAVVRPGDCADDPGALRAVLLVTLYAHPRMGPTADRVRQAAWYHKPLPTFSDALALVTPRTLAAGGFLHV
ncbi:MAG: hypothetical protein U0232_32365 [Thermomicrobiales bacterium]